MNAVVKVVLGAASLATAFAGGYFLGKGRAEAKSENYINEEVRRAIASASKTVVNARSTDEFEDLVETGDYIRTITKSEERELVDYLSAYNGSEREEIVLDDIHDDEVPSSVIVTTEDVDGEEIEVLRPAFEDELDSSDDDDETDDEPQKEFNRDAWRVGVISPEDYRQGCPGHIRESFTYYDIDDVVTDSDGLPMEDDTIFGDCLSQFGLFGTPNDTVYIRNNEKHLDMHVTKVHASYQEAVLGVPFWDEDDSPRKMRAWHE